MHASWLSACQPGADQAESPRPRLGEVPRRDRARGSGPELPEPIGLDQGEQLGLVRGEERDDEPRALGEARRRS